MTRRMPVIARLSVREAVAISKGKKLLALKPILQ
jgi:hypothetical protein